MGRRGRRWGVVLLLVLMGLTAWALFHEQSPAGIWKALRGVDGWYIAGAFGLMTLFLAMEALGSRIILARLGHAVPYRRCLGYSFTGFYVSSVTPSAAGGQPAQVYEMSRDGIPPSHGTLDMLLLSLSYQIATLLYGLLSWLLLPTIRLRMGGVLGALLVYGGGVLTALTAGMLCCLFWPAVARRVLGWVSALLRRLGLGDKLHTEALLEEYAAGARCLRTAPLLFPVLLLLALVQLTALYAVPYLVYRSFGCSGLPLALFLGTQALLTVAVSALPLPGAVGPAEGGFVSAFSPLFGQALVMPAMLVSRTVSFYGFLLVSGGVFLARCLVRRLCPAVKNGKFPGKHNKDLLHFTI